MASLTPRPAPKTGPLNPMPKTRVSPLKSTLSQQEKNMLRGQDMLEAERKVYAKAHNGNWPSDEQLRKFRANG